MQKLFKRKHNQIEQFVLRKVFFFFNYICKACMDPFLHLFEWFLGCRHSLSLFSLQADHVCKRMPSEQLCMLAVFEILYLWRALPNCTANHLQQMICGMFTRDLLRTVTAKLLWYGVYFEKWCSWRTLRALWLYPSSSVHWDLKNKNKWNKRFVFAETI